MRLASVFLAGSFFLMTTAGLGCTGRYQSDFSVLVSNRVANQIEASLNGQPLGRVEAGKAATFTITLPESNSNIFSNGTAPTPQANVTLTAKDTRTGALSDEKAFTLSKGSPTAVTFAAADFPSTGPTIARFTLSPTTATINQDVLFNGVSSTVSNGTFAWDFGDGQTGTGVSTTHRYTRGAIFTVTLTVTSDTKATSTASRTVTISTTLPPTTANFIFSPAAPALNQDVIFTATGVPTDPGLQSQATYAWDFGDGTSGSGVSVSHRYTRGGTFTATLRVTASTGLTASSSRQITISTILPAGSANFVFSPTDPRLNDEVYFNASSSTALATAYTWDFGDGSGGSGVRPTKVYTSRARTYTVTLTVLNQLGQAATISKTVTVRE